MTHTILFAYSWHQFSRRTKTSANDKKAIVALFAAMVRQPSVEKDGQRDSAGWGMKEKARFGRLGTLEQRSRHLSLEVTRELPFI